MFAVMQMFDIIALKVTEINSVKPRKQQEDRLLKHLSRLEKRRQVAIRRQIMLELSYLLAQ
jgi:hypothetical protein